MLGTWYCRHILRNKFVKRVWVHALCESKFLASRDNSRRVHPRDPVLNCIIGQNQSQRQGGIAIRAKTSLQPARALAFFKMLARNQTGHTSSDAPNEPKTAASHNSSREPPVILAPTPPPRQRLPLGFPTGLSSFCHCLTPPPTAVDTYSFREIFTNSLRSRR
jgi:hypothetical protein